MSGYANLIIIFGYRLMISSRFERKNSENEKILDTRAYIHNIYLRSVSQICRLVFYKVEGRAENDRNGSKKWANL